MNFTTAVMVLNAMIIGLVGFVFYLTHSPLSFFILILLFGTRTFFQVKCPKCGLEFKPFYEDEEKKEDKTS